MQSIPNLTLRQGREKVVRRGHPWIFSGAIDRIDGRPQPGETVRVLNSLGEFLAWGAYSPESNIRIRIWSDQEEEIINEEFLYNRINVAVAKRDKWISDAVSDSKRLIYAENDRLPGLIVDRYSDGLVLQILSCGIERWREAITGMLSEITSASWIYDRSDADVRKLEGLALRKEWLKEPGINSRATLAGQVVILENSIRYCVDLQNGQKTGFYLDQRKNRSVVREITQDKSVLDCFAYTGGFTHNALLGGAKDVTSIDDSTEALNLLRKNLTLNSLRGDRVEIIHGDVFQWLRKFRDQKREFDMIILDPPKFAPTAAHASRAARGYKDINLLAFKLLRRNGQLVTFSCSGGISESLFQRILAGAAVDAGRKSFIIKRLSQDMDHPVGLNFPEGSYLKGFIIQVE
jgi:23S rRNA (cytosine1962-C5)-methyltransferase